MDCCFKKVFEILIVLLATFAAEFSPELQALLQASFNKGI